MKTFAAWLVQLIALTAACAAHAQGQPEIQPAVFPAAGGCNAFGCETGTSQATIGHFSPTAWQTFELLPANRADLWLDAQDSAPFDPAEFTRTTPYPLFREEQTWAQKMSRVEELPLLTLWQTSGTKLFFGVSSDGFTGLNFSQKARQTRPKIEGKGIFSRFTARASAYLPSFIRRM